jgi:hypothetical protein
MKLINSPGYETNVPSERITITDKEPVEVEDELALRLLDSQPTLIAYKED